MNDFFDPQTGGLNQLYGFIGQIADDSSWIGNHANTNFEHKLHLTTDIAGASRRVKVQIIGKHVEVKNISDEQLPMAEVLLPTTAGSGHGGSHQTPNLKQGMYVFGFYKDGKQGTQPVIVGVLPNDPRVRLFGGNPPWNFDPRTGFKGDNRSISVSNSYVKLQGPNPLAETESVDPNVATIDKADQMNDGKRKFYTPKTINCEGASGELSGIQKQLKSFLFLIKRIKRASQQFLGAVSDVTSSINGVVSSFSSTIASLFKSLFSKVRGFIINQINGLLTKAYELVPANLRSNLSKVNEGVTNIIQCIFNKIISQLFATVKNLLEQVIEKYVNVPLCAAESFIANVISNFLGDLTSGITDALGGVLGGVLGGLSDISATLFKAFDILTGVLEFLSCDPSLDCQILDEWSFWDGSSKVIEKLGKKIGISSSLIGFFNSEEALGGGTIPGCSSNQLPCGPPKLLFFGEEKQPAAGNLIVGLSGRLMGVDLLTGGRFSTSANGASPIDVKIVDDCGLGNGGIAIAITTKAKKPDRDEEEAEADENDIEVDQVVIIDSGSGYLGSFDGSTGGDEDLFSRPNETIIGTNVFPPGTSVGITSGQIIFLPSNTVVDVVNENQEVVDTLNGSGQTTPIVVTTPGTIVTPEPEISPQQVFPSYDVYVCLEDLAILSEGLNYSPSDEIIITPDNGAKFEPILDQFGSIKEVRIISRGCGFIDVPRIFVRSETGLNANLVPVFSFDRINRDRDAEADLGDLQVVNVVDCVGVVKR